MKKNLFILALAAIALGGVTSCSNSDDVYDPDAANNAKLAEYNQKFVETFGTPAADQDWGFGTTTKTRSTQKPNGSATTFGPGNPDSGDYAVPSLTDEEKADIIKHFSETKNPTSVAFNYSEFLVYNIGGSHKQYSINYYKQSESDHDILKNENATPCTTKNIEGTSQMTELYYNGTHSADYNAGYGSPAILYDLDISSGLTFSYYNTLTSSRESKYVISEYKGNLYLAFDFTTKNTSTNNNEYPDPTYDGDDYYDDWIILLVPGKSAETAVTRVFAEDLGTIGDFDFNDVVFDVTSDGKVILQAAGGTLPLYLEWNGEKKEVHGAFGLDNTSTMVNTHAAKGVDNVPPVTLWTNFGGNAKDIKIFVVDGNGEREIKAITGQPAAKFAVNKAIDWQTERHNIIEKYSKFSKYVTDTSYAETWYINDIE